MGATSLRAHYSESSNDGGAAGMTQADTWKSVYCYHSNITIT